MDISSVSANPPASSLINSIANNAASSVANGVQSNSNQQASTTVTLSAQGQGLSQISQFQNNQNQTNQTQASQGQTLNTVNSPVTPNVVPQSTITNAAPGIQFMTGDSKGGQVDTYA